ncbi:MAG: hypothetical protein WD176_10690 [Pirellulales bacterium]
MLSAGDVLNLASVRQQAGVLLAQRAAGITEAKRHFRELLKTSDRDLLFVIVEWIGEERLGEFRTDLESLLARGDVTSETAASTMAALALLDGQCPEQADQTGSHFYMARLLTSPQSPPVIKARALRGLPGTHESLTVARLRELVGSANPQLRLEAVRTLRDGQLAERAAMLVLLAADEMQEPELRAEATMGLDSGDERQRDLLWKLAVNGDHEKSHGALRREALRTLRGATLSDEQRTGLLSLSRGNADIAALVQRVVDPKAIEPRPELTDVDAWMKLLEGPADRAAGERVFFHSKSAGCYRCHAYDGRGAEVGPDLTLIGRSLDRRRILESMLQPAKDIAPQFFAWQVETEEGQVLVGMLVEEHVNGDQTYVDAAGKRTTLALRDVAQRRAARSSVMADRIVDSLTIQELRDLVAFLAHAAPP